MWLNKRSHPNPFFLRSFQEKKSHSIRQVTEIQSAPIGKVVKVLSQNVPDELRIADQESRTECLIQADDATVRLINYLIMKVEGKEKSLPAERRRCGYASATPVGEDKVDVAAGSGQSEARSDCTTLTR